MSKIKLFTTLAELALLVKASESKSEFRKVQVVDLNGQPKELRVTGLMSSVMEWDVIVENQYVLQIWSESQDGKRVGKMRFYIKGLELLGFEYDIMVELMHLIEVYVPGKDVLTLCNELQPTAEMIRREFWDMVGNDPAGCLKTVGQPVYNKLYMLHLEDPENNPDPVKMLLGLEAQAAANKMIPDFIDWLRDPTKPIPTSPEYFTVSYMSDPKLGM